MSGTGCAAELTNPGIIHSGEVFTISNGDTLTLGYDIDENLTIEAGGSLIIESGSRLIIEEGITVDNFGTILADGELRNNGTLNNSGTITSEIGTDINNTGILNNFGTMVPLRCPDVNWVITNSGTFNSYPGSILSGDLIGNRVKYVTSAGEEYDNGNSQEIPEFPTVALPALMIIGLAFVMRRK